MIKKTAHSEGVHCPLCVVIISFRHNYHSSEAFKLFLEKKHCKTRNYCHFILRPKQFTWSNVFILSGLFSFKLMDHLIKHKRQHYSFKSRWPLSITNWECASPVKQTREVSLQIHTGISGDTAQRDPQWISSPANQAWLLTTQFQSTNIKK